MMKNSICDKGIKENLVYAERKGFFWRISKKTVVPFFSHICHYFRFLDPSVFVHCDLVEYVDISEQDLYAINLLYGIYSPKAGILLLAPVYPFLFVMPLRKKITLHLCVKKESQEEIQEVELSFNNELYFSKMNITNN